MEAFQKDSTSGERGRESGTDGEREGIFRSIPIGWSDPCRIGAL